MLPDPYARDDPDPVRGWHIAALTLLLILACAAASCASIVCDPAALRGAAMMLE